MSFTVELLTLSAYSLVVSFIIYILTKLHLAVDKSLSFWRDYWLVATLLSLAPMLFLLTPSVPIELSLFDFSILNMLSDTAQQRDFGSHATQQNLALGVQDITGYWAFIYCTGVIIKLLKFIRQLVAIKHIVKESSGLDSLNNCKYRSYYKQLEVVKTQYSLDILVTNKNLSPFIVELKSNTLVLPQFLFDELSNRQLALVLQHELTHLRRHDSLIIFSINFIHCFTWFNPFMNYFYQKMSWALEASCDAEVLIQQPNLRRVYASAMLKTLRRSATKTSNEIVAAFSQKTHRSTIMRISSIMKPSQKEFKFKQRNTKLVGCSLAAVMLMFVAKPSISVATDLTGSMASQMISPMETYKVSASYGVQAKAHSFHKGIDLVAPINTPIKAVSAGRVTISKDILPTKEGYGTIIIIDHGNGIHSLYSHMNSRVALEGDMIEKGELIGYVGNTGKSSGPHLHLEIIKDNHQVNPSDYINF